MCYHKSSGLCSTDTKAILDYMSYKTYKKNKLAKKKINICPNHTPRSGPDMN